MKQFIIIMGNGKSFDYYTCDVSNDVSNDNVVKMCENLHHDMFNEQARKNIQETGMKLVGIVNICTFTKVPIVIMLYPDVSNSRFERALNILLDAAGIQ